MKFNMCVVLVTAPSGIISKRLAEKILKSRTAACVNIISNISSFYWWNNKIEKGRESLLVIKSRASLFSKLEKIIKTHHPYDVPEIIALPIMKGSTAYLNWISHETSNKK